MLASIGRASRPPSPKIASNIIDLRSGWTISNESWLLGQVVGYYDLWKPAEVDVAVRNANPSRDEEESFHSQEPKFALCIAVYKWSFEGGRQPGIPWRDWVWWSGPIVTIIQLGISAIPFALYRYWSVFLITVCGTILSYALSILPTRLQLSRRIPHRSVALTEGNGSRHVIVILGDTDGLDLFDLARNYVPNPASIKIFKFILGVLWIALLITRTGIKTYTWFLLAVGGVGMAQNLFLAAMPRHPDALGIPLQLATKWMVKSGREQPDSENPMVFANRRVMQTLMEFELEFKHYGKSLLPVYFPGGLTRHWEEEFWSTDDVARKAQILRDSDGLSRIYY